MVRTTTHQRLGRPGGRPRRHLLRAALATLLAASPMASSAAEPQKSELVAVSTGTHHPAARNTGSRSLRQTPVVTAIQRASPSVVNLHGQKTVRGDSGGGAFKQVNGMGTGVIVDPRGYVITNYHVIESVNDIQVTMFDGTKTRADLIAVDPPSDLALVQILSPSGRPMPTIPRGRSDDLMIGETVIAIGNAFGYVHTSTQGIISALHRDIPVNEVQHYRDLIQTSAGINPGNSGGPLLNIDGDIIGINVAVRVGAQQIAFAIPIDQALATVAEMIERHNEREYPLGWSVAADQNPGGGFRIRRIAAGSLAQVAGLKSGDELLQIGPTSLQSVVDARLTAALTLMTLPPKTPLPVQFARGGDVFETTLQPGGRPAADLKAPASPDQRKIWDVVGVNVRVAPSSSLDENLKSVYRGGLLITAVRPGSEAQRQGLTSGDVLLGLHSWETTSVADLVSILDQDEVRRSDSTNYHIARRGQTYSGDLRLALRPSVATASGSRRR